MKELSIEEKAKRYDEVINRMKHYVIDEYGCSRIKVADVFPELKESEDEQHRKWILEYLYDGLRKSDEQFKDHFKAAIAWLEKQGEHAKFRNKIQIGDRVTRNEDGVLVNLSQLKRIAKPAEKQGKNNMGISEATKQKLEDNLNKVLEKETPESCNEFLDEQGEQKPTDKVEPKFHEDDWVVYDHRTYQVVELPKEGYINLCLRRNGKIEFAPSTYCKYWTIQDAKAGDVLCCENGWTCIFKTLVNDETFSSYCFMDNTKWFCETGSECHTLKDEFVKAYNGKIYPATKEQRDTLIEAMTDAGWEFDFDKKELKKIEQNPAWSEDDQSNFNELSSFILETYRAEDASRLITWLEYLKDRVQPMQEWSEEDRLHYMNVLEALEYVKGCKSDYDKIEAVKSDIAWFKSLKDRCTWKPSEEQLDALWDSIKHNLHLHPVLKSLYQDLKKLREE